MQTYGNQGFLDKSAEVLLLLLLITSDDHRRLLKHNINAVLTYYKILKHFALQSIYNITWDAVTRFIDINNYYNTVCLVTMLLTWPLLNINMLVC